MMSTGVCTELINVKQCLVLEKIIFLVTQIGHLISVDTVDFNLSKHSISAVNRGSALKGCCENKCIIEMSYTEKPMRKLITLSSEHCYNCVQ